MNILSFEFFLFMGAVLIVYFVLPLGKRWAALLIASAAAVLFAGPWSMVYLTAVALTAWSGALALAKLERGRKPLLALLLTLDIGGMMLLKYQGALTGWLGRIAPQAAIPALNIALPLGLSYFTFQTAGYLIDVYRGKTAPQKDFLKFWLFAGYFPQLAQGPISTWREIGEPLLTGHAFDPVRFVSGFQLLLWGCFKKLVVADRLAPTTAALLNGEELPGWMIVGGAALYLVRLYADFSGGMDVVRGFSRMLGIELPLNFKRPFFAQSVADYWRRWHITLGAWFRSYVLYPLTTSGAGIALGTAAEKILGRKMGQLVPTALATLVIFVLIGLWHMASWNALVYGGYFGAVMALSILMDLVWKAMRKKLSLPKNGWMKPLRILRTGMLVLIAQYFAFTNSPAQGLALFLGSFKNWKFGNLAQVVTGVMAPVEWVIAGIGISAMLAVDILCERKIDVCGRLAKAAFPLRWAVLLALLVATLVFGVYGEGYDGAAFLYTQF